MPPCPHQLPNDNVNSTTVDWSLSVGAFMGTQYTPHERVAIFGEGGVNFSLPNEGETALSVSRSRGWGTAGRIGVILFVK